jgi:endo-1,3(4)-beta-glucanase
MKQSLIRLTSIASGVLFLASCGGGNSAPVNTPPAPTPIADTTAPVISLGSVTSPIQITVGDSFTNPTATATDNVDGNVSVSVSGSVGTTVGSYTLTYSANDAAGNSASTNVIVNVVAAPDTTMPVISLGSVTSPIQITVGDSFTNPTATATDNVDGNVSVSISGSVGTTVGSYTLTYSANDAAGNSASTNVIVNVVAAPDTTPPNTDNDLNVFKSGSVSSTWNGGINAFDEAINYGECNNDGGAACPSMNWSVVNDAERGDVLQVTHTQPQLAGLFFGATAPVNLSAYAAGGIAFDIKMVSGAGAITMKLDCVYPCTSGDQNLTQNATSDWSTITVPMSQLTASGLDITKVNTGLVIWASNRNNATFLLDNVRFVDTVDDSIVIVTPPSDFSDYNLTTLGLGSYSDTINPDSYRCVFDFGNWVYNAGVVLPPINDCITATNTPIGTPIKVSPQLVDEAAAKPTATHRWWGSVPFLGEMQLDDPNNAAYITPDPITARVHNRGVRIMGIPSGLNNMANGFMYAIPDPFTEVFDGMSIGSSLNTDLQAFAKDHSDGSITVQWQSANTPVLEATFVHGSPYIYFKALQGDLVLKTLRENGGEKGVFYDANNSLGVWTSVAGNHNNYLVTGEGATTFTNQNSNTITVSNAANEYTVTLLPQISGEPNTAMSEFFAQYARNVVSSVNVAYSVDRSDNSVTVTHEYRDAADQTVETIAGLHPLHWKNTQTATSNYNVRSARGTIKFAQTDSFSYTIPYIGVLPTMPTLDDSMDMAKLTTLVNEFVDTPEATWNTRNGEVMRDAYWSGKNYAKVAELLAIADTAGLSVQKDKLLTYLKAELSDWFTAEDEGALNVDKYFMYDDEWNTVLAMEESFASHQQLNDHHFHYGYFVRAAAEICRHDAQWCSDDGYGGMIKLLIRDYAADRDDAQFPYLRHFDPANGFSWASGNANFARGNNNESTSEAANAYGAMVLFGLHTGDQALVDRGIYLHALTGATYWEYWNNIDGYNNVSAEADNFWPGYDKITTSIIWGDGSVFSTWFSAAYAHILGIQGLPTNPLILHVGLHTTYMSDYVQVGLTESSNNMPSGLIPDQWRDIWWNLMALNDAQAAIDDYNTVTSYVPEQGESKAHTYHWINTFNQLGTMSTGLGTLTADSPSAMAFTKNGQTHYVVYNFGTTPLTVTYSDGMQVTAGANQFGIVVQ